MKNNWIILSISLLLGIISCSKDDNKTLYTVTFETDSGTPIPSTQKIEAGSTVTAPTTNPTKTGYAFAFWHLSGVATAYNFQLPVNNDFTLYAKWQEEAAAEYWQVTWNLNGGVWPSGDNHTTQVLKGGTLTEPAQPSRSGGYTFDGWYKESDLINKIDFPYDVSNITSNFTIYAKWTTGDPPSTGDYQLFTSITALSSWLTNQPINTAEKAYKAGLKDVDLDNGNNWGDLGVIIGDINYYKYVDLDLSGCTGSVIPDGKAVSSSGKITFYGIFINCKNLVAIKLPANLTTIGMYAFRSCEELVSVVLPETVKSINKYAFRACYKLESINLPDGLLHIGQNGFYLCNLKSIVIPEGITIIDEDTFNSCDLTSVILPEGLQTIGRWAFSGNEI